MATGVVTGAGVSGIPLDELHRMTVDEYERLAESGVLDDPQVEPEVGRVAVSDVLPRETP